MVLDQQHHMKTLKKKRYDIPVDVYKIIDHIGALGVYRINKTFYHSKFSITTSLKSII